MILRPATSRLPQQRKTLRPCRDDGDGDLEVRPRGSSKTAFFTLRRHASERHHAALPPPDRACQVLRIHALASRRLLKLSSFSDGMRQHAEGHADLGILVALCPGRFLLAAGHRVSLEQHIVGSDEQGDFFVRASPGGRAGRKNG